MERTHATDSNTYTVGAPAAAATAAECVAAAAVPPPNAARAPRRGCVIV